MNLTPVSTLPPQVELNLSSLLMIKTSDGHQQLGVATFFQGEIHDWIIYRDHTTGLPSYNGGAHSIGCFDGVSVVAWAELPSIDAIIASC